MLTINVIPLLQVRRGYSPNQVLGMFHNGENYHVVQWSVNSPQHFLVAEVYPNDIAKSFFSLDQIESRGVREACRQMVHEGQYHFVWNQYGLVMSGYQRNNRTTALWHRNFGIEILTCVGRDGKTKCAFIRDNDPEMGGSGNLYSMGCDYGLPTLGGGGQFKPEAIRQYFIPDDKRNFIESQTDGFYYSPYTLVDHANDERHPLASWGHPVKVNNWQVPRPISAKKFAASDQYVVYYNTTSFYVYRIVGSQMVRVETVRKKGTELRSGSARPISDIKFSTDGKTLLVVCSSELCFYDTATWQLKKTLTNGSAKPKHAFMYGAWSPDGLTCAALSLEQLQVWDVD